MTARPHLIGWAHTRFGKSDRPDVEALMADVASAAIADSGLAPADMGAISVGVFNSGFSRQSFFSALVGTGTRELVRVPSVRSENACASGSAALYAAADMIEAGRAKAVLVVGAEKMTAANGAEINDALLSACYRPTEVEFGSFVGVFASLAKQYVERYGDPREALAAIAAKNHRNGAANPYAHVRKDLGHEFCAVESDRNPIVADPLLRTDCSMVSDGAAALVVVAPDLARSARGRDPVAGAGQRADAAGVAARPARVRGRSRGEGLGARAGRDRSR